MGNEVLPPGPGTEIIASAGVPELMTRIRPQWQAKGLIDRVWRLLPIDPSSACQRLLNAAIADLREKIKIAGLDIAKEVASANRFPAVDKPDDIDNYSTTRIIELAYRMGLLTRPEYRRLTRAYDIRKDLEHEDIEYEAGIEDCVYVFKACIEAVLAKDPVVMIRVSEVRDVIEASVPVAADPRLVEDYRHAPDTRQLEILKFLVSKATDPDQLDLIKSNAAVMAQTLAEPTRDTVRVNLATWIQDDLSRTSMSPAHVRITVALGVFPYLRKIQRVGFFQSFRDALEKISFHWTSHSEHGAPLRALISYGGLNHVPDEERTPILRWLVLCYVGEPGGYGAGINRTVFFSNSAAPLITEIITMSADVARDDLIALGSDSVISAKLDASPHVERRYQSLLDLVEL